MQRNRFFLFLCILTIIVYNKPAMAAAEPPITAKAAAVIDQATGRVLYQDNAETCLPMASTTKVMTAMLVIETGDITQRVTASKNAAGVEGSSIYLRLGETLSAEQMLYGLLMRSGNDSAVALAEHFGGSLTEFVDQMNRRAIQLGCLNTRFQNPHGLPAEDHFTTALDLARITRQAMSYPLFAQIVSTRKKVIPWANSDWDRVLTNGNKLLARYDECIGVKTGYTKKAGRCLVSAARRGEMTVDCVVLNSPSMYEDSEALLRYALDTYTPTPVVEENTPIAELVSPAGNRTRIVTGAKAVLPLREGEQPEYRIHLPERIELPRDAGDQVGDIEVYLDGQNLAVVPLIVADTIEDTYVDMLRRIIRLWLN